MKRVLVFLLVVAAALAAALWLRTSRPLHVVLVVFDTCRADHLGCYGHAAAETPTVDSLAAHGVLFERAYAQTPLTLPSHTTLFTGAHPESHRIRDNAAYTVPPEAVTLAEVLKGNGYTTAAFVGAFPLDARFGLDQGFDAYDGYFPMESERRAESVNAAVEAWLRGQSGPGPYFLFLHYFDPHIRYQPPAPFSERFRDAPYDGEIAYADRCLGEIRKKIDVLCPPENTVWIFTADHGEGLWEHQEMDHGTFLYDSTVRVPLLWSCPSRIVSRVRSPAITDLADVMPTLLDLLGIDRPASVQGSSFLPVLRGKAETAGRGRSHAETYYPRLRHGWSGLRSLRTDRWLYVAAPREELYDLEADPGQTENLAPSRPEAVEVMRRRLREDLAATAAPLASSRPVAKIDPETEARLVSLGYLGRVSKTIHDPALEDSLISGADPKDRIVSQVHFERAFRHMEAQEWRAAEAELRRALAIDPGFPDTRRMLGETLGRLGKPLEAAGVWRGLVREYPEDPTFHMYLAHSLEDAGRGAEAVEAYRRAVTTVPDPSRAQAEFVLALARMKRWSEFASEREKLLGMDHLIPETLERLARDLLTLGDQARGTALLEDTIRLFPNYPEAYNGLAWELIESRKDLERGVELAETAVRLDPTEPAYRDTRGWGYLKQGRTEEAVRALKDAARGPYVAEVQHHLAVALLAAGEDQEARTVLRGILERAPGYEKIAGVRLLLGEAESRGRQTP